jgi:6-pyruvoyltetrahydropterin/6-carboxytetrahydropterin synthase
VFRRLEAAVPGLDRVVVHETCTSAASCSRASF